MATGKSRTELRKYKNLKRSSIFWSMALNCMVLLKRLKKSDFSKAPLHKSFINMPSRRYPCVTPTTSSGSGDMMETTFLL